jgi:ATP-dependent DNA ligase
VAHAIQRLAVRTLILDGEMAVYDHQLISRFEWLRHAAPPELATPPLLMVFDCLWARGKDLRAKTLYARRNVLEEVLAQQDLLLPVRRLSDDGQKAWREVIEKGWEGLVAKDPMAPYVGGRTLKWLKVKQPRYREGARGWEPNR